MTVMIVLCKIHNWSLSSNKTNPLHRLLLLLSYQVVQQAGFRQPGENTPGAVVGGSDGGFDETIYVDRLQHEGAIIPGKLSVSLGVCYVARGGADYTKFEYEVLCNGSYTFVPVSGGKIPPNAPPVGESEDGEPLFNGVTI
ncbi:uncharacterized protein LOC129752844 [Uranotaenia lowii]|uniref:uncharacterized protein LOC129752844 n=1 Tax=Uranotaenia lowii TaxID=190385 RepID=UPI002479D315|nr:uncharacterized protein LOC129752844 [Uranotaenia lowii]